MKILDHKELLAPFKAPKFRRLFWAWFVLLGIFPVIGVVAGALLLWKFSQDLPNLENLERIEPPLISKVYDKDSVLIHEFYTERRIWTDYQDLPKSVIQAVVAIEDRKFFKHWGVNVGAYPPALLPALIGKRPRGASTLTQQLAKNLFLSPERSVGRKIKELLLAIKIEQTYTKEEILEFYMNEVYLGGGAYGFQAAAQKYFSKSLDSLSIAQQALLAGLLPRPESYRPDHSKERAEMRRNLVLQSMYEEDFIDKTQLEKSLQEPITLKVWNQASLRAPYFVETIRQDLEQKWNEDFIYGKGVNIFSTLDYEVQKAADSSYQENLRSIRNRLKYRTARFFAMSRHLDTPLDTIVRHWDKYYSLFDSLHINGPAETARRERGARELYPDSLRYREAQAAVVVIENETGAIRALIGGEDFEVTKFNRAIQALRSPGSAFKAIVYTAAIDNGASPMDSLNDQPITIPDPNDPGKTWRPKNYDDNFTGNVTVRKAFYQSKNLPAIKLGIQYGLHTVIAYARKFGLSGNIPVVPSIGIGAGEATVLEMTSAFSVFPNGGMRPDPYYIEEILDKNMRPIYKHIPRFHEVIRGETAYLMTTLLQDVNIRGTGAKVGGSGFRMPSGGKTGTTNNETDAWYIGFTPYYTTGVWVGTDDHKAMGAGHTGSRDALPIWLGIMQEIHKDLPRKGFGKPGRVRTYSICQATGKLAGSYCSKVAEDYFQVGRQPQEQCDGNHRITKNWSKQGDAFTSQKKRAKSYVPPPKKKSDKKEKSSSDRVRKTF